jgi:hypothetical protein
MLRPRNTRRIPKRNNAWSSRRSLR